MSLQRRIHHQGSRQQLVREFFFIYILAFVFTFLDLHFFGIRHYYPSFHREYLPVNPAALQASFWALIVSVLCMIEEYVLQGTDLWTSFQDLDLQVQRLVLAGAAGLGVATFVAWRWMLPLWAL